MRLLLVVLVIISGCKGSPVNFEGFKLAEKQVTADEVDAIWDHSLSNSRPKIVDLTGADPCENKECGRHEICIVHDRNHPMCISKKEIYKYISRGTPDRCVFCPRRFKSDTYICGSDGETYASGCEMNYLACIKKMKIWKACNGKCPCKEDEVIEGGLESRHVVYKLGVPASLVVTSLEDDVTSAKAKVSWSPPLGFKSLTGKHSVIDYIIHYCKKGDAKWREIFVPGSMTSLSITGLQKNALYYFRIQASTRDATGPLSDAVFHFMAVWEGSADDTETDDVIDNEEDDVTYSLPTATEDD